MAEIHKITKTLSMEEKYRVRNQIERSSASVSANIAEGYMSFYYNDKIKSLYTARKEAAETQNHLRAIESRNEIRKEISGKLIAEYEGLIRGINSFINYVRKKRSVFKTK